MNILVNYGKLIGVLVVWLGFFLHHVMEEVKMTTPRSTGARAEG